MIIYTNTVILDLRKEPWDIIYYFENHVANYKILHKSYIKLYVQVCLRKRMGIKSCEIILVARKLDIEPHSADIFEIMVCKLHDYIVSYASAFSCFPIPCVR